VLTEEEKKFRKAEYSKRYLARDPERWRAVRAKKYAENREFELSRGRAYRVENRARLQEYERVRNARDKERISERVRSWRAENQGHRARWNENRRARIIGAPGVLSKGIFVRLFCVQQGKCAACGSAGERLELDHIIPLSRGGSNEDENVQLLCRPCNAEKSNKLPHEFRLSRGAPKIL